MTTVSVRDLRYDFKKVEELLRNGQEIQITKRNVVIGRIVPEKREQPPMPDFAARVREIYGDKQFEVSSADLLAEERDRL